MEAGKTTGPHAMRFMVDVPSGTGRWPLIVFCHGIGERSDTNLELVMKYGPLREVRDGTVLPFKFIGIHPQLGKSFARWNPGMIWEVIQYAISTYPVDENRIYLMGVSLGGGGVWSVITDPNMVPKIAAAVIMCGGFGPQGKEQVIVNEKLPMYTAHAKTDTVVPYSVTEQAVTKINAGAGQELARLARFGLWGHLVWEKVLQVDYGMWDWLKFQRLDARKSGSDTAKFDKAVLVLEKALQELKAL